MPLHIYTAHSSYTGMDRLCISREANEAILKENGLSIKAIERIADPKKRRESLIEALTLAPGLVFAPSWNILKPFVDARKGAGLSNEMWAQFALKYKAEMRESYKSAARIIWDEVTKKEEGAIRQITLTCYCKMPMQCHRTLLGKDILPTLGAIYCGEWQGVLL